MGDNLPVAHAAGDVARPVGDVPNLHHFLDSMSGELEKALRSKIEPEYFVRVAISEFTRNPKLLECTKASVATSLLQLAEVGLLLHSALGHGYLVPYYNKNLRAYECQAQVGYRGLIVLCRRAHTIQGAAADVVYEKDEFEYMKGTDPYLRHRPALGDRGKPIAVYGILYKAEGPPQIDVWGAERIEAHKKKFVKRGGGGGIDMWRDAWEWAWKKTVLRGLCKLEADSPDLSAAAAIDEYNEAGVQHAPVAGAAMRDSWANRTALPEPETAPAPETREKAGRGAAPSTGEENRPTATPRSAEPSPPAVAPITADEGAPAESERGAPSEVRVGKDGSEQRVEEDPNWDFLQGEGE